MADFTQKVKCFGRLVACPQRKREVSITMPPGGEGKILIKTINLWVLKKIEGTGGANDCTQSSLTRN